MQVSINLRKDKKDKSGRCPVLMTITFNSERFRFQIPDVKSSENNWNSKTQRIRQNLKKEEYNNHIEFNKIIDNYESKANEIIRYLYLNEIEPTKKFFEEKLKSKSNLIVNNNFFDCFEEFIDTNKSTKVANTIKNYNSAKKFLNNYQEYSGEKITFDIIDIHFFERLRDYAFEVKKSLNNTFSKHIDIFKTFMRWAEEREYHKNTSFKKFKTTENEIEVIYLTKDELFHLLNFEFEKTKHSHVRDVYCFSCFTGLRFSDVYNLNRANIFEDHIKLNIQKTKTIDHIVPLNQFAKQIFERYENTIYYPLPVISSQKFNEYIKEACEIAEINTPVSITRYSGQKRIDDVVPKHKLITSHTARKTFVTNSVIMGMNISVLKKITGHKKEESFRKYVNISEELKKNEMENTWDKMK